jgi:AcrR family transcriptional regulator
METPLRVLRAHIDKMFPDRPPLSQKERERLERIIAVTQTLLVDLRRKPPTISGLARSLGMTTAAVQRHFLDIDSILAEILVRHLTMLAAAIGKIPNDDPNRMARQRIAYIEATRTADGGLTEPHRLLVHRRHTLPKDLLPQVEQMRLRIGETLGGKVALTALMLLDQPGLKVTEIETMLAVAARLAAAPEAKPAPPQAMAPPAEMPRYHHRHTSRYRH